MMSRDAPADRSERSRATVPRFLDEGARWAWRFLVVVAALGLLVWLIARLAVVLIPVAVALILSSLLSPLVDRIARKVPRLLATWIVLLLSLAGVVGVATLLGQAIAGAVDDVVDEFDDAIADIEDWLQTGPLGLSEDRVDSLSQSATEVVERFASGLLDEPSSTVRLVVEVGGGFFLMLVLVFFFLKDGPQLWAWLLGRISLVRRTTVDASGRAAFDSLQGWIRGVAITGVVDGTLIGGAMLVLGVPAAIPLAVLTVLASFFPIVGATVAGALAVAIALSSQGVVIAIVLAVVVLVVQQVEGDVILPLVMRRQVSLHPIVILVSLAVGGAVGGLLGALVAVPLTASVNAAVGAAAALSQPREQLVIPDEGSSGLDPGTDPA